MREAETGELRLIEAVIFASPEPVTRDTLRDYLPEVDIEQAVAMVQAFWQERGVQIVAVAGGWSVRTAPDLAPRLRLTRTVHRRLSRVAMETLAIIAYHQPVTRAEIEEIRGVSLARSTLETLVETGWVEPGPRRRSPGRPLTWKTTIGFLEHFGLADLRDLPELTELEAAGLLDARPAAEIVRDVMGDEDAVAPAGPETDEGDDGPQDRE